MRVGDILMRAQVVMWCDVALAVVMVDEE